MILKKELTPVTPPADNGITQEDCDNMALCVISQQHTDAFIAQQNNPKLAGFKTNGESCLQKVQGWNKSRICFFVLALLTIGLGYLAYDIFGMNGGTALLSTLTIIVGAVTGLYGAGNLRSYDRPGTTEQMVAKAWKLLRKDAIRHKIVENLTWSIKCSVDRGESDWMKAVKGYRYNDKNITDTLSYQLDSALRQNAKAVKDAERDGQDRKRNKHRNAFYQIHNLASDLGFKPEAWEHYFGQS